MAAPPNGRLLLALAAFVQAAAAAFTCLPANNAADCGALGDLYSAAGGAAWAWVRPTDGWSLGAGGGAPDVCAGSFTGVTCDASGRVASISLIQKGLVGSLPASLGNLTGLTRLSVSNNNLTGTIPDSLCGLTNLNWLSLFNNNISGTIPNCIGGLVHLQNLFLGNMQLTGTVPQSLGSLTAMQQIGLHLNSLSGTLPSSLGNMLNATLLWVYGNRLDGAVPTSLCRLTKLMACDLHAQSVAFAPCHFGSCSVLTSTCHVPACGNFLLACAPSNDATVCRALSDLYIATAGWAWSASAGWAAAASNVTTDYCSFQGVTCVNGLVTQISLASNNLNGTLPASLANVSTLRKLSFETNSLSGVIPEELSQLTDLQELVLYDNKLTGPIPTSLPNMSALTFVAVSGNLLSGALPASFCQMQQQLASGGVFGCVLATFASTETNTFACPLPCTDAAGASFISKCGIARCTSLSPSPVHSGSAEVHRNDLAFGLGLGLGGGICLILSAGIFSAKLCGRASTGNENSSSPNKPHQEAPAEAAPAKQYDVFISYRRVDHRIMETVTDKLKLAGLSVFVDRAGDMAGLPFKTEIFQAMKSSAVVVPLITSEVMRTLSSYEPAVWDTKIDFLIVEFLFALHLLSTGAIARVYPLLVGDEFQSSQSQRIEWDNLLRNANFKKHVAALPDVVPRASLACAYSVISSVAGEAPYNLPPDSTVRDIVCGKTALFVPTAPGGDEEHGGDQHPHRQLLDGILSMDAFPLACPQEDLDLYIRGQFVPNLRKRGAVAASTTT